MDHRVDERVRAAFITLGLAGLLLLVPVGPMLGGARLRRLAHAADAAQPDDAPSELLAMRNHGQSEPMQAAMSAATR